MEVYRRITEKVRGALWAHHRRLMPERQFHRILAYVYNNKYEFQIRLDRMQVVGKELGGQVEVVCTPAGHINKVRVNPSFQDLSAGEQRQLILSAYSDAVRQGRKVMEEAETQVYHQFLRDLKPIVMGIRDNPEFYTVPEDAIELPGGTLASMSSSPDATVRTIPFEKARQPAHEHARRERLEAAWLASDEGKRWARTVTGKKFIRYMRPESRPRGAPGPKTTVRPFEMLAPYTPMDEGRLQRTNWMAYLDNKHVAERMWTKARIGDRVKAQRLAQKSGVAWHAPVNDEASRY